MLDTWEQRVRRDGICLTKISFPVPPKSQDELADRLLARDHAGDPRPALLPHHEPDRADLPGAADLRRGAAPRRQDHRRRRARLRALSLQGVGSRLRLLRHQPAQVAARADRHGLSLRAAREHPGAVAADAGRRREGGTTSGSSRRSARIRPRTTTRSPKRWRSTRASASSARRRACATCATAGRRGSRREPEGADPHQPRSRRTRARSAPCSSPACRRGKLVERLWARLAHHRDADRPRRVRRRAGHAERLHDARRDRHLRLGDGADRGEGLPPEGGSQLILASGSATC